MRQPSRAAWADGLGHGKRGAAIFMRRTRLGSMVSGAAALVVGGILGAGGMSGTASAAGTGYAEPGQIGFQVGVTPIANNIHWFHDDILDADHHVLICLLVGSIAARLHRTVSTRRRNPVPSKTTHNTLAGSGLDRGAGAGAGDHRGSLVPPADPRSSSFRRPTSRSRPRASSGTGHTAIRRTKPAASTSIRRCCPTIS